MFKYILVVIVGIMLFLDSTRNKQINIELEKRKATDPKAVENNSTSNEKPSQQ